jgi:hypothetical protein
MPVLKITLQKDVAADEERARREALDRMGLRS